MNEWCAKKIPSVFISKRHGSFLAGGSYKIVFNNTMITVHLQRPIVWFRWEINWYQLKPELQKTWKISFSSLNDNTYGMSGTSIASSMQVCSLVKEYLVKNHPELTPEQQVSGLSKPWLCLRLNHMLTKETGVIRLHANKVQGLSTQTAAVSTDLYDQKTTIQVSPLEMLEIFISWCHCPQYFRYRSYLENVANTRHRWSEGW